jgi:curved DNA-binding protein CbpA
MLKNYYQILGVEKDASLIDIKKAYRDLAIRLHPDKNESTDAHNEFVELNEAFQILSNEHRRIKYDALYEQYILLNGGKAIQDEAVDFKAIHEEARAEGEVIANSNFYFFVTDILSEMVGQVLIEGLGSILKGTGEILEEALSNIEIDF